MSAWAYYVAFVKKKIVFQTSKSESKENANWSNTYFGEE